MPTPAKDFDTLAQQLAPHYSRFAVDQRLLFTGHSHQAWPDVAREGQLEAFDCAAQHVDEKWETALTKANVLRNYLKNWYDDDRGQYCLAENTHLLLCSWLSALDLKRKPRILTTDGEFHSLYRQLHRLQEMGIEVIQVASHPIESFADRLIDQLNDRTAAVMISRVYFETSLIQPSLQAMAAAAQAHQVPMLIDDYHGTHVAPLSIQREQLQHCYLVTGGYKYLQWGEGNCFLRYPEDCPLKPVMTGWYASFSDLDQPRGPQPVGFNSDHQKFATATYDPTSQFRAARVVEFFQQQGLTKTVLQHHYQTQIQYLANAFSELKLPRAHIERAHAQPLSMNGGFLSLRSAKANALCEQLKLQGVLTDCRGDYLRFGVAPYITRAQMDKAMNILAATMSLVDFA
ncbi:hypothetical protein G8770_13770 [Aestuariicella hydrocarbonica]|uniref:Kynureninase n=1 Tax=Pseudomaricurvus hydrocarbonicus TaxID=1470433 RepID=A0A9E5JTL5_9GAMM|nr:hypothetical protein [Aestuariicella hydrocarbonica]NHO66612.1 hypothetical protein [Aestuariicella hydrocarbonica]